MALSPKSETSTPDSRGLTEGEIELARQYFGDKIDYSKVKVSKKSGMLSALTGDNALAPDGNIYMPESAYKADYSRESVEVQAHFMHEMTHVWQKQSGRSVVGEAAVQFAKHMGDYSKAYHDHDLDSGKAFKDMNLEQQADFIAAAVRNSGAKNSSEYMAALRAAGLADAGEDGRYKDEVKQAGASIRRHSPEESTDKHRHSPERSPQDTDGGMSKVAGAMTGSGSDGSRIPGDPMPDPVAEADMVGRRIAAHNAAMARDSDRRHEQMLAGVMESVSGLGGSMKGLLVADAGELSGGAHPSGISAAMALKTGQAFTKG